MPKHLIESAGKPVAVTPLGAGDLALLAGAAVVVGVALDAADTPLVQ